MTTQTDAMAESSRGWPVAAAEIPVAQRMYWALRREFWESRFIYISPLAVAGAALLGFLLSLIQLPQKIRAAAALDPMQQHEIIEQPYDVTAGLLMGTLLLVVLFYCVEALQRERRDRSILFWKSLPVSDLTTVAAKAGIAFVVLPLLTVGITVALQFFMLLASSVVLAGSGQSAGAYWTRVSFFQMAVGLLYHIVTVHVLWSAPIYGWLLLISAWARRAAFLWVVLPPLAIGTLEKLLFNSTHFAEFLGGFVSGGPEAHYDTTPMDPSTHFTLIRFLSAPRLWIGLLVTVGFLAIAVRLRRYREPMLH